MTADPRLAEIFNRVCDELEAAHGPSALRTAEPATHPAVGHPFMTGGWFLNLSNHGFKLYDRGGDGAEILTWAHTGPLASARVQVRSWDAVEPILRAVLPPALSTQDRAAGAPLSESAARETGGSTPVSPVAGGGPSATPAAAVSPAAASPPTPHAPSGVGGHQTPADSPGGGR